MRQVAHRTTTAFASLRLLDHQRSTLHAARLLFEIKMDEAVGTTQMLDRLGSHDRKRQEDKNK